MTRDVTMATETERRRCVMGEVLSGRGKAAEHIEQEMIQFREATGEDFIPGSLNIALAEPIFFDFKQAKSVSEGERLLWKAHLMGEPVWVYRFPHAPLHIVEVLSTKHLRNHLDLRDGQSVPIEIDKHIAVNLTLQQRIAWILLWKGRETWSYKRDNYYLRTRSLSIELGATQAISKKGFTRALLSYVRRGFK